MKDEVGVGSLKQKRQLVEVEVGVITSSVGKSGLLGGGDENAQQCQVKNEFKRVS